MTSSEGLLSLVNQLQNMETAMGLFLIETALKLSTFHDTKFLVMVDLPEGRKIAGKGEMIQVSCSYTSGAWNDIQHRATSEF